MQATIRNIIRNQPEPKGKRIKLTYTIQKQDYNRLNKEGVLRIYNLSKPVDIPITLLLGKWKNTHIGVTMKCINEKWEIEKGLVKHVIQKHEPLAVEIWH